ncbi:Scramblase-domain-containing protein [Aaosphaeria arxii CBS 175.79]|uniref:Scramblase-domain-containing protein n=1 Tax=Aaosphaeria arxii CBS 175.79 TaxID=1450172 RepID=A0A6A5Y6R7_9PLEO|nr:Scramblase-domain-containing protein [Aaosphaeria arxii CBS 175.79]KAF2021255.1 Scramblase-domain-containing protein [Aaosphaeria arxii CBS 175.79]
MILNVARLTPRLPRPGFRAFTSTTAWHNQRGPRDSLRRPPPVQRRIPPRRRASEEPNNSPSSASDSAAPNDSQPNPEVSKNEAVSNALAAIPSSENDLVTPVHIPEDPNGVLKETHPAMRLLDNSAIVIQRQLEMMNVLMGFEQANRYIIMDPHGNHIGYLAEQEHGVGNAIARQMFRTHRSFTTHVFDREEKEILRFHRPFSWISSRIRVYDAVSKEGGYSTSDALRGTSTKEIITQANASISNIPLSEMRIIGSAEQEWAPLRRRYNIFLARDLKNMAADPKTPQLASGDLPLSNSKALAVAEGDPREIGMLQFARVDEPFLSWDFSLMSQDNYLIGSVNRNFSGFARELFTDTGVYALRMDAAGLQSEPSHLISHSGDRGKPTLEGHQGMTLDQRALMLATAVSIDFDYFSRHSGAGGGMWPMWIPWWGGGAAGEAGAVGAAAGETGIASEAGAAARGLGAGEGAIAGAGTMAGYEAMQRSQRPQDGFVGDDASPQSMDSLEQQQPSQQTEEVWGSQNNPWDNGKDDDFWGGGGSGSSSGGNSSSGGDSGGGDGGGGFDIGDWL